ncbi:hypothetical protein TGAM01_v202083 [Trichoderma gamsii]|uniref:Peptidase A1 domain-containing protein n=1 Tax=Trichoderma gamsii TaxID=398673 RepID=A0A2P4ZXE9_9HYPO|nr:hypothetical protein TGAM01_v202083 [Trichoderma gamsii]PON28975.1 hypothetical protein TGAM01_v202083 [Trichoderma gamsii]
MTRILSVGAAALAASSVIGSASAASLYAFYTGTDAGVQIGMQDPKSGDIWVNDCAKMNNGNPLFPTETPLVLPVSTPVKMGGGIAATGWWDSQKVITSVFWHSVNGTIVNAIYNCDNESGTFVRQGPEYVISETANVKNSSIHENTGLAVELLGSTAGYRVFYHDNNSQVQELFYTTKTNWNYGGIVSQDPVSSFALGTGHSSTDNITVVFPKSDKDIEVSRFNSDKSWHISTFPDTLENSPTNKTDTSKIAVDSSVEANFSLPAWNGAPGGMGVAIDSTFTRSVFYIGTDRLLHEAANINFAWKLFPNQSSEAWPEADEPNATMAATFNFQTSEAWIYYVSGGSLVQAYRGTSGDWSNAAVISVNSVDDETASNATGKKSTGLSNGAKAGVGVGVSLGVIAIAGLAFFFFFHRRRRQQAAAAAAAANKEQPINLGEYQTPPDQAHYMADGSMAPPYSPQRPYDAHDPAKMAQMTPVHMLATPPPPVELEQPPMIHELPPENYSYELPAESVEHR